MKNIKIALIEFSRSNKIDENLSRAMKYLEALSEVDIAFFPENWLTPRPISEEYYAFVVKNLLRRFNLKVFSGLTYVVDRKHGGRIVSRGYFYDGVDLIPVCEKLFPSKAVGEREKIASGAPHEPIRVGDIRVGCIACVDIFYPEIARFHVMRGATILYNPAGIPSNRLALWHSVLSSRAAENIAFVVGVNGIGYLYPDGRLTGGGSIVLTPDGRRAEPVKIIKNIKVYNLDLTMIGSVAERWAYRQDLVSGLISRVLREK